MTITTIWQRTEMIKALPFRLILFPFILLSLVTGLLTGLFRIGWYALTPVAGVAHQHGALMVGGVLGTLIILERAISLKKWYAYTPAVLSGASLVFFFLELPTLALAHAGLTLGSLGLVYIMYYYYTQYQQTYQMILTAGAACWFVGNALLLWGKGYFPAVPWWMAFLLLTITAERLELSRFTPVKPYIQRWLLISLGIFVLGCCLPFHQLGGLVLGIGWLLTGSWLIRWDIARKAIHKAGIHRYGGSLLLAGYGWLLMAGGFILFLPMGRFAYDAIVHSFFIGFVFSMIFAHAPIILPAILKVSGTLYHPSLYTWGIALHLSLVGRVIADLQMWPVLRKWAALITGFVILFFMIEMAILAIRKIKAPKRRSGRRPCAIHAQ